jgi:hypothetical protein
MLGNIVKRFEWPLVRKALYKCSSFKKINKILLGIRSSIEDGIQCNQHRAALVLSESSRETIQCLMFNISVLNGWGFNGWVFPLS